MARLSRQFPRSAHPGTQLCGVAMLVGLLACACSEPEHAALLKADTSRGGTTNMSDAGASGSGDPGAVATPLFDPNEVYLIGTRVGESRFVQAHWRDPLTYSAGFPTYMLVEGTTLHGSDLYYVASIGTHKFVPEFTTALGSDKVPYPEKPVANDPLMLTPPCTGTPSISGVDGPALEGGALQNLPGPDGNVIYSCPDGGWYEDGLLVYKGGWQILAVGHSHLVLVGNGAVEAVQNLDGGSRIELKELTGGELVAVRASADGFHVVFTTDAATSLYAVHADGSAEHLGEYPRYGTAAEVIVRNREMYGGVLDPNDVLFQLNYEGILRRTLDGSSDIYFGVGSGANTGMAPGYATLVTGP